MGNLDLGPVVGGYLVALLNKNKKNLTTMLTNLPAEARALAESVAGGPFFAAYVGNFTPDGFPLFPDEK